MKLEMTTNANTIAPETATTGLILRDSLTRKQETLTRKTIIMITSLIVVFSLQVSFVAPSFAAPKGQEKKGESCSAVKDRGKDTESVHKGKCENVCKDKEINRDYIGRYGGSTYWCQADASSKAISAEHIQLEGTFKLEEPNASPSNTPELVRQELKMMDSLANQDGWQRCIGQCTDDYLDCQLDNPEGSLDRALCNQWFDRCVQKCDFIYPEDPSVTRWEIIETLQTEMKIAR